VTPIEGLDMDQDPPAELVAGLGLLACCAALARQGTGMLRGLTGPPRVPPALVPDAGLPPGTRTVRVEALPQVVRRAPAPFVVDGVWRPARVEVVLTAFLVRHPAATFLVDPGVCRDVERRAMRDLPRIVRPAIRPPAGLLGVREALDRTGTDASGIDFALPTHLHWDHVSGLLDLPGLPVRVHDREWSWAMAGEVAPVAGVRPALRERPVEPFALQDRPVLTFARSHDVFGDGAVVVVDLAGHTPGSVGVLLRTGDGPVLLAGDAVWNRLQVEQARPKAGFPGSLFDADRAATLDVVRRLHAVRHRVRVVPAHDPAALLSRARPGRGSG
jgi:glyoxylase-like metal-dependent hydrolase (beta-lactamase superfamily II)